MKTNQLRALVLVALGILLLSSSAQAVIVVYDLRLDFSDAVNPNGTWAYLQGATPLPHFSSVPQPNLAPAAANGYWGASSSNFNSLILKTTANGSSAPPFSDNDFLANHVLVRTTDPASGGPMIVTWTAPSAGSFTYSGDVWYAGTPLGPGSNDFLLTLNNGPAMESGTAGIGQDESNPVTMVNGLTPTIVNPGDVLALKIGPSIGFPFGSLAGIGLVVDFTPAPEPSTLVLGGMGTLGLMIVVHKRRRALARA
jgi:hypothetical protein